MEVIKKKIKRSKILNNGKITPNLNTFYYLNILLTAKNIDWGFFDAINFNNYGSYYMDGNDSPIGLENLLF